MSDYEAFIWLVKRMRRAQKDYFKTKDANKLMESKDLETQVDKWVKRHEDEQQGPALF